MKYRISILFTLLTLSSLLWAQDQIDSTQQKVESRYLKTLAKVDLGLSGLGLSLEMPIGQQILLEGAVGLGAGYKVDESFKYRMYFEDPAAFASVHAKYYYNQQNRIDKGRPVNFNAGNFFGLKAKYTTPTLRKEKTWHTLLVGFHWGMQRKIGKHFLYQMNVGVGAAIDVDGETTTTMTLFPDFNFRVSYVLPILGKRK